MIKRNLKAREKCSKKNMKLVEAFLTLRVANHLGEIVDEMSRFFQEVIPSKRVLRSVDFCPNHMNIIWK